MRITQDKKQSQPEQIKPGEIHVWSANLDRDLTFVHSMFNTLSANEKLRAAKFRFEQDRDHFVVGRGFLRNVLAVYLGLSAGEIQFSYSRFGKPSLIRVAQQPPLHFNLSHSNGMALLAVSATNEIGIDIEFVDQGFDWRRIADNYFSAQELSEMNSISEKKQTEAFFTGWTRKEALIKALGMGLSYPLNQFEASMTATDIRQVMLDDECKQMRKWTLVSIPTEPRYVAALAIEDGFKAIRFRKFSGNLLNRGKRERAGVGRRYRKLECAE
ncbi:MAG: 4'-phosphopantetheinyl transferase family protein [Blastocatellia bacterium]